MAHATRNQIVEDMSFIVTKNGLIEARFRSICDAKDFHELIQAKYPDFKYEVMFQFYNDHNCLMVHRWGDPLGSEE